MPLKPQVFLQNFVKNVMLHVFCPYLYSMTNLNNCKRNQYYSIKSISELANINIKRRLLELGFVKGTMVRRVKESLSKGTILVDLRGYLLSMRADIAAFVLFE